MPTDPKENSSHLTFRRKWQKIHKKDRRRDGPGCAERSSVLLRICSRPECTDRPCYVNTRPRSIVRRPDGAYFGVVPEPSGALGSYKCLAYYESVFCIHLRPIGVCLSRRATPHVLRTRIPDRVRSGGRRGLRLTYYAYVLRIRTPKVSERAYAPRTTHTHSGFE